jgi:hypothetical protein
LLVVTTSANEFKWNTNGTELPVDFSPEDITETIGKSLVRFLKLSDAKVGFICSQLPPTWIGEKTFLGQAASLSADCLAGAKKKPAAKPVVEPAVKPVPKPKKATEEENSSEAKKAEKNKDEKAEPAGKEEKSKEMDEREKSAAKKEKSQEMDDKSGATKQKADEEKDQKVRPSFSDLTEGDLDEKLFKGIKPQELVQIPLNLMATVLSKYFKEDFVSPAVVSKALSLKNADNLVQALSKAAVLEIAADLAPSLSAEDLSKLTPEPGSFRFYDHGQVFKALKGGLTEKPGKGASKSTAKSPEFSSQALKNLVKALKMDSDPTMQKFIKNICKNAQNWQYLRNLLKESDFPITSLCFSSFKDPFADIDSVNDLVQKTAAGMSFKPKEIPKTYTKIIQAHLGSVSRFLVGDSAFVQWLCTLLDPEMISGDKTVKDTKVSDKCVAASKTKVVADDAPPLNAAAMIENGALIENVPLDSSLWQIVSTPSMSQKCRGYSSFAKVPKDLWHSICRECFDAVGTSAKGSRTAQISSFAEIPARIFAFLTSSDFHSIEKWRSVTAEQLENMAEINPESEGEDSYKEHLCSVFLLPENIDKFDNVEPAQLKRICGERTHLTGSSSVVVPSLMKSISVFAFGVILTMQM